MSKKDTDLKVVSFTKPEQEKELTNSEKILHVLKELTTLVEQNPEKYTMYIGFLLYEDGFGIGCSNPNINDYELIGILESVKFDLLNSDD